CSEFLFVFWMGIPFRRSLNHQPRIPPRASQIFGFSQVPDGPIVANRQLHQTYHLRTHVFENHQLIA
ncbi:hypothetical protein T265_05819, partial [Opisthorchis viverrini]